MLAVGSVALVTAPMPASAQLIDTNPQTKEEARAARDAADEADGGGSVSIGVWLGIAAFIAIGGAAFFIFRDARTAAGPEDPRRAPARRPVDPAATRAVPKTMFEGEGSSSNPVGKNKKRQKSKRQKAARRANRPKR